MHIDHIIVNTDIWLVFRQWSTVVFFSIDSNSLCPDNATKRRRSKE